MSYRVGLLMVVAVVGGSCRSVPQDPEGERVARLGGVVRPTGQDVELTLDPTADGYQGTSRIMMDLSDTADRLRFHALGMDLDRVSVEGIEAPLPYSIGAKGVVTVSLPEALAAGPQVLSIAFHRPYDRRGTGIYKVERDGQAFLFTQMEPEHARTAVPCWDAPEFKIPWTITVTAPTGYVVMANMPVEREQNGEAGWRRHEFEPSPPMPSYLLALAVGPFESTAVTGMSIEGRIVYREGQGALAAEAVRVTPPLLKTLEAYFDTPYPYPKLDQIAVPEFNFGAMENVGLITYREPILLVDAAALTVAQKRRQAGVIAHELAHMWFGNLVTPAWWDDLWLNESFASWMGHKVVFQTFPDLATANRDIESRRHAMDTDALRSARAIRQPVPAAGDMTHLFDALAYSKGMAVLNMIENWLGEDVFRQGMVRYMKVNRWGVADAFDLADALDTLGKERVNDIMASFITQPGIPLLRFSPAGESRVRVTQQRYAQRGTVDLPAQTWTIPLVLGYGDGAVTRRKRVLLSEAEQVIDLDLPIFGGSGAWLHPDIGEKGYYRWAIEGAGLARLGIAVRSSLGVRVRIGFLDNLAALLAAGDLDAGTYLQTVSGFAGDEDPEVLSQVVASLNQFAEELVPPELEQAYGRFLVATLSPVLSRVGRDRAEGEDIRLEDLRASLIETLGVRGGDRELRAWALESVRRYLDDPYAVDPALAPTFLRLAAREGNPDLFEAYAHAFERIEDPARKRHFLDGLGAFRDPAIMKRARAYALSDAPSPQEVMAIPRNQADSDENRRLVFAWLMEHYDTVVARIPEMSPKYFPWLLAGQSPSLLDVGEPFLKTVWSDRPAMAEEFREVSDVIRRRSALQQAEGPRLAAFLKTSEP